MKVTAFGIVCVVPLFASLAGCRDDRPVTPSASPEVYSIRVEPASLVLVAGGGAQLAAQADDVRGETVGGVSFSFASADPRIARISATGRVSAPGPAGRTEVRVASGGRAFAVPVAVNAGPAARVDLVEAPAAQAAAGESLGTVRVRLVDAHGNAIGDRPVEWRITQGGGTLIDATPRTGADGGATAQWRAGPGAGAQTIEFMSEGLVPRVFSALAHAGPPALLQLRLAGSSEDTPAGVDAGQPAELTATVTDVHGNAVPGAEVVLDPASACGFEGGRATTDDAGTTPPFAWTPRAARACRITARVGNTEVGATLDVRMKATRPPQRR